MPYHRIYVKNMVCNRCIEAVQASLESLEINFQAVQLGEIHLTENLNDVQWHALNKNLEKKGFAILENQKAQIINRIKSLIIQIVQNHDQYIGKTLSHVLAKHLLHEYTYLSALFSSVEGITIEKYYISQRVEKAKELLFYNEKSLTEIADELGYSSVAHLSSQFKKITGMTPTGFKQVRTLNRIPLDQVGNKTVKQIPTAVLKSNTKKKKK